MEFRGLDRASAVWFAHSPVVQTYPLEPRASLAVPSGISPEPQFWLNPPAPGRSQRAVIGPVHLSRFLRPGHFDRLATQRMRPSQKKSVHSAHVTVSTFPVPAVRSAYSNSGSSNEAATIPKPTFFKSLRGVLISSAPSMPSPHDASHNMSLIGIYGANCCNTDRRRSIRGRRMGKATSNSHVRSAGECRLPPRKPHTPDKAQLAHP